MSVEQNKNGNGPSRPAWLTTRNVTLLVIIACVAVGLIVRHIIINAGYSATDDAYLTSDVISVAPQVSGTVSQVLVKENQEVKAGDLLVVLHDAPFKTAVAQRQADLDAAIAQAKGAGASVALTSEMGSAQTQQAQGALEQAQGGTAGARADLARSGSSVNAAMANSQSAAAAVQAAQSMRDVAVETKQRNLEAVSAAEAQLDSAKAGVGAAQANVDAAQAMYDKAAKDAQRYAALSEQGAASKQAYDSAKSGADAALAQLQSAKAQVTSAKSLVAQRQADLRSAKEQVKSSDATIAQSQSQLAAARAQANAAEETVHQAEAQRRVVAESIKQAEGRRIQAMGQLRQAETAPQQVHVSQTAQQQALAKVEQAQAALTAVRLQLSYTRIYASANGMVSKKSIEVGAYVQPGTPLMALVIGELPWVMANFKETQLDGVEPGCSAEVTADAMPGREFRAHVDSISPATGSTFALLPADNATGNFTKVVQRVPVKIVIEPGQPDADRLSAGMSVFARVKRK